LLHAGLGGVGDVASPVKNQLQEVLMKNKQLILMAGFVLLVAVVTGPACATKKFVRTESATLDQKISEVSTEVEASQKRISEHDEKLTTIGSLISQHDNQFKAVEGEIGEVKTLIKGNLVMTATLKNDDAKFAFNNATLSPEAKGVLDAFVQRLVTENKGVYIEIQGHTDSTGTDEVNMALGRKRAESVMMYLYQQYKIPLHRMSVVSLGSSMPLADNGTRDGRSQNRRVEILVYE
jgi:outer membrane protein OmpA-like peptidoglycan-associated protein